MMNLYIAASDHARKLKFSNYVKPAIYKQNVSISLLLSDSLQCRRGLYFRAYSVSAISQLWDLLEC